MTVDPVDAPDTPVDFAIHFEKGIPVQVVLGQETTTGSVKLFKLLNKIGHDHGIGRIDIVETRFVGLKSRGCVCVPFLQLVGQTILTYDSTILQV